MKTKHLSIICLSIGLFLLAGACSKESADISVDPGQAGSITRFAVHNGFMYALNPNQVRTFSLENPDKPQLVHTLTTDYGLETIIIYDNTIFLGSRTSLYILDISNPATPSILSQTQREDFLFGGCDPVVVKDNFAYSTIKIIENVCGRFNSQSALMIYDVSNHNAPVNVGVHFLSQPNGLGYKDNYLFVCDEGSDRLEVFDITDPMNVRTTTFSVAVTDPVDLIVKGDKMIVSSKTEFRFFDISNIADIRPLGRILK